MSRADLYALMRGSIAVVNPSLFEGWSTTVEEAKAIGAPLVLSDIAVHREQAGGDAVYFEPHSATQAAAALVQAIDQYSGNRDAGASARAQARNSERLKRYAGQVEDLIERLAAAHSRSKTA
ncbi:MAG: glycosyltransferase [Burkholderiales bacterium]|nr:glycosyltransferase [Burkholderiales bacterium]